MGAEGAVGGALRHVDRCNPLPVTPAAAQRSAGVGRPATEKRSSLALRLKRPTSVFQAPARLAPGLRCAPPGV